MAVDTQLKLNVTNIRSVLISGRKQEQRISSRKTALLRREQQREERADKERSIEKIRVPTLGIPNAIGNATSGIRSGLAGFLTNLLLGFIVNKLPEIRATIEKYYEKAKPIIDGAIGAIKAIWNGAKFVWDKLTWLNDAIKDSGAYRIAGSMFNRMSSDLSALITNAQNIANSLRNALKPMQEGGAPTPPPPSYGASGMMSGQPYGSSTGGSPQPRNKGGEILNTTQSRLQDHRDDKHRMNPIRLFPRVADKNKENTKFYSKNVGKFEQLIKLLELNRLRKKSSGGDHKGSGHSGGGIISTLGAGGGALSSMSDDDWKYLGFVVSSEAERDTDDEYGVAASVLNRVASNDFPSTIKGVVFQHKQYEAVTKGMAHHDPALVAKLRSSEGQAKIVDALNKLQGRTDFKGTTQYANYVPGEDIKFSSRGNFFHYSWQTGRNSVKPVGFADVDYQRFIKKRNLSPTGQQASGTKIILQPVEVEKVKYINPQRGGAAAMMSGPKVSSLNSTGNYHSFA